jgi:tight adherence protein C
MISNLYLLISLAALAVFAVIFLGAAYILASKVPPTVRLYMDEVPASLSKFWWLVNFFQHYVVRYLPASVFARRKRLLAAAGLEFFLTPEETYALQFLSATFFLLFTLLVSLACDLSLHMTLSLCLITSALGWFYFLMWLKDQKQKKYNEVLRTIPTFLDILTLCAECGLSLNAGLINYCDKGPEGVLRREVERALRDVKGGASRSEALSKVAKRMANPDFSMFVSMVAQSERLGTPLGEALRSFSEQKRTERFQRAEKLAMEAPMKIIGPLVIFIFPITLVIIAFPIVVTMMQNFNQ